MGSRDELYEILHGLLPYVHVYLQPPTRLVYPCLLVKKSTYDTNYSNDEIYKKLTLYTLTLIGMDADDAETYSEALLTLRYCSHERQYIADNLYHDVFDLYF